MTGATSGTSTAHLSGPESLNSLPNS